jgi:hypothetical protein
MEFEIEYLHPKVWVFKNVFPEGKDMINYYEDNFKDKWESWYVFGKHLILGFYDKTFDNFPSQKEWEDVLTSAPNKYIKSFSKIFYETTKKYCNELNIELDNWIFNLVDIAFYNENIGINKNKAMNYHTDYQQEKELEPGNKFEITAVFYLNDDYDGGEISFRIFNDDLTELKNEFKYKPSAGDVLIFPSKHPFYHGVEMVTRGEKYIIRSYWKYNYAGHPIFFNEREKYSQEEWEKISKDFTKEFYSRIAPILNKKYK